MAINYLSENIIKFISFYFDQFNALFFQNIIDQPIISLQYSKTKLGWAGHQFWISNNNNNEKINELNINPGICLNWEQRFSNQGIYCVLLHEMIHLYHFKKNIKGANKNNVHNKKFINDVNQLLKCEVIDKHGHFSLTDELINLIKNIESENSTIILEWRRYIPQTKKPTISYKYFCLSCNMKLTLKKRINIKCGDCDAEMIVEQSNPEINNLKQEWNL